MLKWYKITGPSQVALDNITRDVRNGKMLIRRRNGDLFACVSTHHQGWLSKICADFNGTLMTLDAAPVGISRPSKEEYTAPCGETLFDPILYSHHIRVCAKCKELKGAQVGKATPTPKTKIEPGLDFDLNGVIASVELTRDRLYEQVEIVDDLLKNLKGFRDAKETISKLSTEVKERREAVRLLLADGGF